ncbi:39S ribosomal protein L53, mitochondrial [Microplitis mediator]|uniref:39S ribosomal protein L53, mitochondrial n=1 Tax=Microplitis mediator TaxID=375433 RepID=UPI0025520F3D|nr:39S ribosomal protein L53, mitochondrial [Microplitis mediator]
MSIPFTGRLSRSAGLLGAIGKQVKLLNLQPTKKITVQFDPFYEKVKPIRDFLFQVSTPKVLKTNLTCVLKTNIVCDRSEPTVTCELVNGEKVLFKCENLDTLDLLTLYNKHITPLAPPEEIETKGIIKKKKSRKTRKRRPLHRR